MSSAVEEYYTDVLRSLAKTKGARCPGEEICTTDRIKGEIARRSGETLETFCNKERCVFFPTKPGTVPASLISAINTIEDLQDDTNIGIVPSLELSAWEIAAFKAATRARKIVENEELSKDPSSSNQHPGDTAVPGQGDKSGITW